MRAAQEVEGHAKQPCRLLKAVSLSCMFLWNGRYAGEYRVDDKVKGGFVLFPDPALPDDTGCTSMGMGYLPRLRAARSRGLHGGRRSSAASVLFSLQHPSARQR